MACRALFDGVSSGIRKAWDIVKIDGQLNEDNVKAPMREIRRALLEADVSLPVVRGFVKRVQDKALGVKVLPICAPGHLRSNCLNRPTFTFFLELEGKWSAPCASYSLSFQDSELGTPLLRSLSSVSPPFRPLPDTALLSDGIHFFSACLVLWGACFVASFSGVTNMVHQPTRH